MTSTPTRRRQLLGSAAAALLAGCASRGRAAAPPPIVFVHGNGDSAALWTTTLWRFESNGWPRERLHALDMPYPLARDDDTKPQDGRSSTAECRAWLDAAVERALTGSDAQRVVLIACSRGGNAVRSYIAGGGADRVSHAILCGTPNHGVFADARRAPNNEFNGAGTFLAGLNAPQGAGGLEVTPGPQWLTIRSDANDKYAQPEGTWIGQKGVPTNVGFDGPALKGAENVVIAGIDHRETACSANAFEQMFRFITGQPPVSLAITPETRVVLGGTVGGYFARTETPVNLAPAGASVEVYAVQADTGERLGGAVHSQTIGADGRFGPLVTDARTRLEFVVAAPGYATTHIYRSPFARSSAVVQLRPERLPEAERNAAAVVVLARPRGYFGVPRDQISLDGISPAPGIPSGVPGVAASRLKLAEGAGRAVVGTFNDERIVGRAWPAADNAVTYLELTS